MSRAWQRRTASPPHAPSARGTSCIPGSCSCSIATGGWPTRSTIRRRPGSARRSSGWGAGVFVPADVGARPGAWRPPGARAVERAIGQADRLFDRVYSSRYNPLYRTGTLASLCLAIALATGVYLLFVYEIGRPYESVEAIQRDAWLGRWVRA